MSEQSDFNCDFNAPMFVDFDNLDQEGNPDVFFGKFYLKYIIMLRMYVIHKDNRPLIFFRHRY